MVSAWFSYFSSGISIGLNNLISTYKTALSSNDEQQIERKKKNEMVCFCSTETEH